MGSTSQQFCLKWNNHSSNMLNVFETLLTSEQLVDVTLACDGLSLKAHKMVLSACSPFFQSLFQENPCKHPIVILKDIRYTDLKAIIDFMYKGEVNVGQAHLSALLKTAETLKVKGLAEVSGEDGQSSSGSVVQQEVPVFPQAQHSSDVANIVQTIDSSVRPSSDSPTGRKRKRTKWKNRAGQSGGNDSETDDQGPAAKNQEIVSAEVIEDDSSSIGVVEPSDTRNAKESRIIIEEATIVGDYVEPAALMEQNMTTDNVQPVSSQLMLTNATSKDNNINVPESRSYDTTVATMNPETVDLIDRPEDWTNMPSTSSEIPWIKKEIRQDQSSINRSNLTMSKFNRQSASGIVRPMKFKITKVAKLSGPQNLNPINTKEYNENMDKAVRAVTLHNKSLRKMARFYNIPYTSLWCRVQKEKRNIVLRSLSIQSSSHFA